MTKEKVIEQFKIDLTKPTNFHPISQGYTTSIFGMTTLIDFKVENSVPANTDKIYHKVCSLEEAKDILVKVLDDKPQEDLLKLFDKKTDTWNIDLTKNLFLTIYVQVI